MNSPCVYGHTCNCVYKYFCYKTENNEYNTRCTYFISYDDYLQNKFQETLERIKQWPVK